MVTATKCVRLLCLSLCLPCVSSFQVATVGGSYHTVLNTASGWNGENFNAMYSPGKWAGDPSLDRKLRFAAGGRHEMTLPKATLALSATAGVVEHVPNPKRSMTLERFFSEAANAAALARGQEKDQEMQTVAFAADDVPASSNVTTNILPSMSLPTPRGSIEEFYASLCNGVFSNQGFEELLQHERQQDPADVDLVCLYAVWLAEHSRYQQSSELLSEALLINPVRARQVALRLSSHLRAAADGLAIPSKRARPADAPKPAHVQLSSLVERWRHWMRGQQLEHKLTA